MNFSISDGDKIAKGGAARIAQDYFRVELTKKRERIIIDLINFYRTNDLELPIITGKIAELSLVMESLSTMDRDMKMAHNLEGKTL